MRITDFSVEIILTFIATKGHTEFRGFFGGTWIKMALAAYPTQSYDVLVGGHTGAMGRGTFIPKAKARMNVAVVG